MNTIVAIQKTDPSFDRNKLTIRNLSYLISFNTKRCSTNKFNLVKQLQKEHAIIMSNLVIWNHILKSGTEEEKQRLQDYMNSSFIKEPGIE